MKHYNANIELPHPVYSELIEHFWALGTIKPPSKNFILLLAADFSAISSDNIKAIARKLIDNGLAYILTWGPECEKAHDAFDLGNIEWQADNDSDFHVMSTWHSDEPLEEAIWEALFVACVTDDIWDETSIICISVNSGKWFDIIDKSLSNLEKFNEERINT